MRCGAAALRLRPAHRDYLQTTMRAEEWLLVERREGEKEPVKYFLSTAPVYASLAQLVFVAQDALAHRARLPGHQTGLRWLSSKLSPKVK